MLRLLIAEKIMGSTEAFDRGMLIYHAGNLSDNNPSMYDLPYEQCGKWAYSGQSSFFLYNNLVL